VITDGAARRLRASSAGARRVVGAATALLFLSGIVGVGSHSETAGRRHQLPRLAASIPLALVSPEQAAVDSEVSRLETFVAGVRGKPFVHEVPVELLAPDQFVARLHDDSSGDGPDPLAPLGLSGAGKGPTIRGHAPLDQVEGFYDVLWHRLVVKGVEITPAVRRVLVHELTHAWQDQHVGLGLRPESSDQAMAELSLVEGDAARVERRWVATLSAEDRAQASSPNDTNLDGVIPFGPAFPYVVGQVFVSRLVLAGGLSRLDGAFASPPMSTAQVLEPERYLRGDKPVTVARPDPDGSATDEDVLGELGVLAVLHQAPDVLDAYGMASAWAGDRYVTWTRHDGLPCIRDRIVATAPDQASVLRNGLATWAAWHGAASVVQEGPLGMVVTSCGSAHPPGPPGPAASPSATVRPAGVAPPVQLSPQYPTPMPRPSSASTYLPPPSTTTTRPPLICLQRCP